jgi:hypothetical protein
VALDFYAVRGDGRLLALVVEEFVLRDDHTAAALDSACFDGTWWSSADYSRRLRTDTTVEVQPVSRHDALACYAQLGGSALEPDAVLRTHFTDRAIFPEAEPLRLGPDDGRRIYRMLFARDLDERHLTGLLAALRLSPVDDPRVAGRSVLPDAAWELRRVGDLAWSIDVTVPDASTDVGPLIGTALLTARGHGLIPVTVERFA